MGLRPIASIAFATTFVACGGAVSATGNSSPHDRDAASAVDVGNTPNRDCIDSSATPGNADGSAAGLSGNGTVDPGGGSTSGGPLNPTGNGRVARGSADPCAPSSGTPIVLANAPTPWGIAVDDMNVYWATQQKGALYKAPLAGGAPTMLGTDGIFNVAIDSNYVYAVTASEVVACSKAGCNSGTRNLGMAGGGIPYGIAVDDTRVYWATTSGNRIFSVPISGGLSSAIATASYPYGIAVDATSVYFAAQIGLVEKVPKTGTTPVTIASGFDQTWVVAVDASNAYFTAAKGGQGLIMQVPIGGGTPVTLVANASMSSPLGPWSPALVALAIDATSVYWSDPLAGTIRRVKIGGGCVVTLATGQPGTNGIAVDDDYVYWTDTDNNSVMKVAK